MGREWSRHRRRHSRWRIAPPAPVAPAARTRRENGREDLDLQTFFNLGRALSGCASPAATRRDSVDAIRDRVCPLRRSCSTATTRRTTAILAALHGWRRGVPRWRDASRARRPTERLGGRDGPDRDEFGCAPGSRRAGARTVDAAQRAGGADRLEGTACWRPQLSMRRRPNAFDDAHRRLVEAASRAVRRHRAEPGADGVGRRQDACRCGPRMAHSCPRTHAAP